MTIADESLAGAARATGDISRPIPTLIVVDDGSDSSKSAVLTATRLAEINDIHVRAVSVMDADEIARSASESRASLVTVGMNGEDFASCVSQLGYIPLLAVAKNAARLPQRIMIAMDLDPSQLGDIVLPLSLFGQATSVECVHVQQREDFPGFNTPAFRRAYDRALDESFAEIGESAKKATGVTARLVRLTGDPATEIRRFAESSDAELIVLGRRRHFGAQRLTGGRVVRAVLSQSPCSVLIVPEHLRSSGSIAIDS